MFRRRGWIARRVLRGRTGCREGGREAAVRALVDALGDSQLDALNAALAARAGPCLLPPARPLPPDPVFVVCAAWRWPDLNGPHELKRLPSCPNSSCLNPFHWSRLCRPEWPPPPYCRYPNDRLKTEDGAVSEDSQPELRGSLSTNGEGENARGRGWCLLAYWELASRVGRQYPVEAEAVDVFWSLAHGAHGLCLSALATYHPPDSVQVRRAREKIGRGLTLSKEKDGVWAYNLSENPLFVNSPCLEDEGGRCVVARVPPGHCLNVFKPVVRPRRTTRRPVGPIDSHSVRISFAKGWGPQYTRQDVTNCPVWLEVLLAPCR